MNRERRLLLERVIFEEESELEHRSPSHPQVTIMRGVRNLLLDDAGVNQARPGLRWSHVEALAAKVEQRKRVASPEMVARGRALSLAHGRAVLPERTA